MISDPIEGPLGARLLEALERQGARALFGIPGDFVLPFFRIAEATSILPLYMLSHEPSAGFAADAAARHGQGIGVVAATYGAGALNLVNAVACAYAEQSPLVVIAGGTLLGGTPQRSVAASRPPRRSAAFWPVAGGSRYPSTSSCPATWLSPRAGRSTRHR